MRRELSALAVSLIVLLSIALTLNNNIGVSSWKRAAFIQRLDRARETARNWVLMNDMAGPDAHRDRLNAVLGNPALLYMLANCDQLSGEHAYAHLIRAYFAATPGG